MIFTVYILRTNKSTLYIGQTNNLDKRLKQHHSKKSTSAKYLRRFDSFECVYTEIYATRALAMKRELALKKLTHKQKESLIYQAILG